MKEPRPDSNKMKKSFNNDELERFFDSKKRSTGYYNMLFQKEEKKIGGPVEDEKDYFDDTSNASTNPKSTAKVAPMPEEKEEPKMDAIESIFVVDKKCIIRVNDPNRIRWDLFVMFLATWN